MKISKSYFLITFLFCSLFSFSQFDEEFYLPSMWRTNQGTTNQPSELICTTPYPLANVRVRTVDGTTLDTSFTTSSGTPFILNLSGINGDAATIPLSNTLNVAEKDDGLLITSDVPIQAVYRLTAVNNQAIVTLKGTNGLGTNFWPGSQTNVRTAQYGTLDKHFVSVMATENNTSVTFTTPAGYTFFGVTAQDTTVVLQKYENFMLRTDENSAEWISGIHVTSDKDIAMVAGSQHVRIDGTGFNAGDAGIDQPTALDDLGDEYIIARGKVANGADYIVAIATENSTVISIDGVLQTTLANAGDVFEYTVPGNNANVGEAVYISANKSIAVYHVTGGLANGNEVGMSAIPPIACNGSKYLEFPEFPTSGENNLVIYAPTAALSTLRLNGNLYSSYATHTENTVPVRTDWTTVTIGDADILSNNILECDEFLHLGILVGSGGSGTYGFLSGFNERIEILLPDVTLSPPLPAVNYPVDTLSPGDSSVNCILAQSCGVDHDITAAVPTYGTTGLLPAEEPSDTCFEYFAPTGFSGIDTVTVTVINEFGVSSDVEILFFVKFVAPVANPDQIDIQSGGTGSTNVAANDTDENGNLDPGSVTIISGPSTTGATASRDDAGNISVDYSGAGAFLGNDTVFYEICDSTSGIPQCDTSYVLVVSRTENCSDGIDNDGDGLIDCFDGDCAGAVSCETFYFGQPTPSCQYVPTPQPGYVIEPIFVTDSTNSELDQRSAVMVGDLDGDGIPEIVGKDNGTNGDELFVFSGRTGETLQSWNVAGGTHAYTTVALGEVNTATPNADIFVVSTSDNLVRYEYGTGTPIWTSSASTENDRQSPQLADFDEDGTAEVYVGNRIFSATDGTRLVNGGTGENKGAYQTNNNLDSWPIAYNVFNQGDADPVNGGTFGAEANGLELIAGDKVYLVSLGDGTEDDGSLTLASELDDSDGQTDDGFTAIADMDGDDLIDVIVTDGGRVYVWNPRTEALIGTKYAFPGTSGGRPNVGDFDNDGDNEISVAGQNSLTALFWDGSDWAALWVANNLDDPSQKTGSTLFDLEGDGNNEIIYSDEEHLYVFRGTDGAELSKVVSRAGTRTEYPLVVDVNADGQAEIIVTGHRLNGNGNSTGNGYIAAYRSTEFPWVTARTTWNQHGYYVTNVNDDLTIPQQVQEITDPALNNVFDGFLKQTTMYTTGATPTFAAPNPQITITNPFNGERGGEDGDLSFDICGSSPSEIVLDVTVSNDGDLPLAGTMPISYYKNDPLDAGSNPELIKVSTTGIVIEAGGSVEISDTIPDQNAEAFQLTIIVNHNGNLSSGFPIDDFITGIGECDTTDNIFVVNFIGCTGVENDSSETPMNLNDTLNVVANDANPGSNDVDLTILSGPSNGSATVFQDTLIIYNPDDLYTGLDSIQYELCVRDTNICDTGWAYVHVNQFPVANEDAFTLDEDNTFISNVLANDTDADTLSSFGDTLTIQLVNGGGANFGTATITANDSTLQYVPNLNVNGVNIDTVDYRVCDKFGQCDTSFVVLTIDPVNDAPDAVRDDVTYNEDTTVHIDVLDNDSDVDVGDVLTTTQILAGPTSGGTATIVNGDSILYSPAENFFGTDTIVYEICDNGTPQLCDSDTIFATINTVNDAPEVDLDDNTVSDIDFTNAFTEDGGAVSIADVDPLVTDVDNTTLTNAIIVLSNPLDGSQEGLNYTGSDGLVSTNSTNDTILVGGPISLADLTTIISQIEYNNTSDNPTTTDRLVRVAASDGALLSDTAISTITINGTADAPNAVTDNETVGEDSGLSNFNVASNDTDADGDLDATSVTITSQTVVGNGGTVTVLANGTIDYIPGDDFNGTDTIVYQICDGTTPTPLCDSDTLFVTVNPVADAPDANTDNETIAEGAGTTTFNVASNDTDVDGDLDATSVTVISSTVAGNGGTLVNNNDGTFDYTADADFNGSDTIIYRVCDGTTPTPLCDNDTLFVTVTPVADAPDAVTDNETVGEDSGLSNFDVASNDSDADGDLDATSVTITSSTVVGNGGTVTVLGDGTIDYTPGDDFNGTDTIVYEICDNTTPTPLCDSDTLFVTVTPVADAPDAVTDNETIAEGAGLNTFNVVTNDTDVDGDLDATSVTIVSSTVAGNGGTLVNNNDGTFDYTADADFNGSDTIIYRVCDGTTPTPLCDNDTLFVTVTPVADAPDAVTDNETVGEDSGLSNFDVASNDSDADGDLDATSVTITSSTVVGNGGTVTVLGDGTIDYTPGDDFNGTDTIVYQICDGQPVCDSDTLFLTVTPVADAPDAVTDNETIAEGAGLNTFNVVTNDTDVDGDLDATSVTIVSSTVAGNGGTLVNNNDGTFDYTALTNFNGSDTIIYRVCDGTTPTPLCDNDTLFVTVTPVADAPDAVTDNETVGEDSGLSNFDVASNDTDADGDLDATSVTITSSTVVGNGGTVTVLGDGTIDYTPGDDFNGSDTIVYQICDGQPVCDSDTLFVTVTPVVDAPDANTDTETLAEGAGTTTFNVISNDTDADGDLDATSVTIVSSTVAGNGGTLVNNNDGTFDYTALTNFNGSDTIIYRVCDGTTPTPLCDNDTLFVTIVPVADDPIANTDNEIVNEDSGLSNFIVASNDTDADGDLDATSVTITSQTVVGNGGTVTVLGDGTIDYTPGTNFNGLDTIIYQICDSRPICVSDTLFVTVNAVNDTPVASEDVTATNEDTPVNFDVQANDTDVDGDALITTIVTQPSNGTAIVLSADSIQYTPDTDFTGRDTVRYRVCDASSECDEAFFIINVAPVNDPPIADTDVATTSEETIVVIDVQDNDSDVDNDPLTTSVIVVPSNGTVTIINNDSIRYEPDLNFVGVDTIIYQISDGNGRTDSDTVFVTVTNLNDAPDAITDAVSTAEDVAIHIDVQDNDSDVDNDPLTTLIIGFPSNGTVTVVAGDSILYTPNTNFVGSDTIVYQISDGNGEIDSDTVFVTVTGVNDAPNAVADLVTTQEDVTVVIDVQDNDSDVDNDPLTTTILVNGNNGTTTIIGNDSISYEPNDDFEGVDTIVYQISDGNGEVDSDTIFITVTPVNDGPQVVDGTNTPTDEVQVVVAEDDSIDVRLTVTDVEGNTVDITSIISGPNNGTITGLGDGDTTITYKPDPNYNGQDTVKAVVCDNGSPVECDTVDIVITVTPVNDSPVAIDDAGATNPGVEVNVHVGNNDSDIDGDVLTFNIIEGPNNGSAFVDGDSIKYTPVTTFLSGADTIKYTVCDGTICDTAIVVISVPDAELPPNAGDDNVTVNEDTEITIGALTNDSDPNNDPIDITQVTSVTAGAVVTINVTNDSIIYTPAPDFVGTDTVEYIVCDNTTPTALCDTAIVVITVAPVNDSPVITDGSGTPIDEILATVAEDDSVEVKIDVTDVDGDPLDIVSIIDGPSNGTFTGLNDGDTTFTYIPNTNYNGQDTLKAIVCDNGVPQACDTVEVVITVTPVNDDPLAVEDAVTTDEEVVVFIDVQDNDTDVENDPLTTTSILVNGTNGTATIENGDSIRYEPNTDFVGNDTIVYQISDGNGGFSSDTIIITVNNVNDAPETTEDFVTTDEEVDVIIDVQANDSDIDGDALTTTIVTNPSNGTVKVINGDSISYEPNTNFVGVDTIVYVVSDGNGVTQDTVFVTVNNINDTPVAVNDVIGTLEETIVQVDVQGNDTDADNDPLTTTIVTQGSNGTATVINGDSISYEPGVNFNGIDTISYRVCDASSECDEALLIVTVNGANDTPDANTDNATTQEDEVVIIDVQVNDTDPDGDALITTVLSTANGSTTILGNDSISYEPNADFNGTDTLVYEVCDPFGACDSDTVFITVIPVNDGPQVVDGTNTPTDEVSVTVPEDDSVNVRLTVTDIEGNTVDITSIVSGPNNGAITGLGDGDTTITYKPDPNYNGPDTVTAVVCDNGSPVKCDTVDIIIDVIPVNDAPVTLDDASGTNPGVEVNIHVESNDTDIDGDALSLTIIEGPNNGSAFVDGDSIKYTPVNTFLSGSDTIKYTACDPSGICDTAIVVISVPDAELPPLAGDDNATVNEDTEITIGPLNNDIDPNSDPIEITQVTSVTAGAVVTINATNDSIIYTPAPDFVGMDTVEYIVCDNTTPTALCDTAIVVITVAPVNDSPVITDGSGTPIDEILATVAEDDSVEVKIDVTDVDGDPLDIVSIIDGPSNGTFTGLNDGDTTFTYIPNTNYNGQDTLQAIVCDNGVPQACDTVEVVITVTPVNDDPFAVEDAVTTDEEVVVFIDVQDNDTDVENDPLTTTSILVNGTNGTATIENGDSIRYEPNTDFVGNDTIVYQISDGNGGFSSDTIFIMVNNVNDAPETTEDFVTTDEEVDVVIDVQANDSDVDGDALTTTVITQPTNGTTLVINSDSITYLPNDNFVGVDTIVYEVCDPSGACANDSVFVTVNNVNDAPIIVDGSNNPTDEIFITLNEDEAELIGLTAIDIDGNTIDIVNVFGGPLDGTITGLGDADTALTYTPRLNFNGQDTLFAVVCDNGSPVLCDTVQVILTIFPVNDRPEADDDLATAPTGTTTIIDVQRNDIDIDGDDLITTIIEGPNKGTAILLNNDSINYTSDVTFTDGIDTLKYTVCDPSGLCDTAIVQIFVPFTDLPPVAVDDNARIDEDVVTLIDVLDNDFDANGDSIFVSSIFTVQNGTATIFNGEVQYTPNQDFFGTDSLEYILCDTTMPTALCDTGLVVIIIDPVNDAPQVVDNLGSPMDTVSQTTPFETPIEVCLSAVDAEGDAIDVQSQIDPTINGTVIGLANGDTCFTYTPDPSFMGTDTLSITTCDNFGACDTTVVLIVVAPNGNPIITDGLGTPVDDIVETTNEDTPVLIVVNGTDPDSDSLDVVSIIDGPSNGTTNGTSDGDTAFVYTPDPDFNGNDTLKVIVCDINGGCDTAEVVITVDPVNDDPVITDGSGTPIDTTTASTTQDTPVEICIEGTDVDGDVLDVTSAVNGPNNGGVSGIGDSDTCFTYTPDAGFTGNDTVSVVVCDLSSSCDTVSVIITVSPSGNGPAVVVTDTVPVTVDEDGSVVIEIDDATDPDNDNVDITTVISGPNNGTVTGLGDGDTTITYVPDPNYNGPDTVTVEVCDVFNQCDTLSIVVTVDPLNDDPIIVNTNVDTIDSQIATTDINTPVDVEVDAVDPDGDNVDVTDVVNGPTNGTITVTTLGNGDTTFTYVPDPGFVGNDTMDVVVCDDGTPQACDTVEVIVSVSPAGNGPAVVANDTVPVTVDEDTPLVIEINDAIDPDNDNVDIITVISGPSNGTVTGLGDGDTTITYVPDANYNGPDTVSVTVCDVFNQCDTLSIVVTVDPVNDTPVITDNTGNPLGDTTVTTTEGTPIEVCIDALDADGDVVDVTSIGCGPDAGTVSGVGTGNLCVTYTPDAGTTGNDTICLVVCDASGSCDTLETVIVVTPTNNVPVVNDTTVTTLVNTLIKICLPATDIDGDSVKVSGLLSGMGSVGDVGKDTCFTYTPVPDFEGVDTIVVSVCDDGTPQACKDVQIIVTVGSPNGNPIITNGLGTPVDDIVETTNEDTPVLIVVNGTDPDSDSLDVVSIIDGPSNGTTNGTSDGDTAFVYTPDPDFNGNDTLKVIVCDINGGCDTAEVVITVDPVNDDPVITDGSGTPIDTTTASTTQDTPVEICIEGTDVDGDVLDVTSAVNGPNNGGVSGIGDSDTCFTYTPDGGFTGNDTVSVVVCDPSGSCDTVSVVVTVSPSGNGPAVVANDTVPVTVDEDTPLVIEIDDATDPDNDNIDITTVISGPDNGTVTGLGDGDTTITYVPNPDYNGPDTVVVEVCDVFNQCDTLSIIVTVDPLNDHPVITNVNGDTIDTQIATTDENTPVDIKMNVEDVDVDAVDVTDVVNGPSNGTITLTTLGNGDTTFTYVPDNGFVGNDTMDVVVCDNGSPVACDTVEVIVSVSPLGNGPAVVANDTVPVTVDEDTSLVIEIDDVTDPDNDNVDIITVISGPSNGTVTGLGNGDTTITYIPDANYNGPDTVSVTVCDVFNQCDTLSIVITVDPVNDTPVITDNTGNPIEDTLVTTTEGTPIEVCIDALDADGDVVDITSIGCGPDAGTVSGEGTGNLCVTYTPDPGVSGNDTICLVVCDALGACDTLETVIVVTPTNNVPVVNDTTVSTLVNTPIEICLPATDIDGDDVEVSSLLSGMGSVGDLGDGDTCFTYTPVTDFEGVDTIVVSVCDNGTPQACKDVQIIVVITSTVITDPSGNPIDTLSSSTDENTPVDVKVNATDVQGDPLDVVSIVSGPSNGTITGLGDGDTTFTYTPNDGFTGTDVMEVVVCDNGSPVSCDTVTVVIIVNPGGADLEVFNGVSPDNDGQNDVFIIKGIENYPNNKVYIFNRWGNLVYEQEGYDSNDSEKSWFGQSTKGIRIGDELPEGTYFYIIEFTGDDNLEPISGYIELDRE